MKVSFNLIKRVRGVYTIRPVVMYLSTIPALYMGICHFRSAIILLKEAYEQIHLMQNKLNISCNSYSFFNSYKKINYLVK